MKSEGKILTPLNIFFSIVLLYPFIYNIAETVNATKSRGVKSGNIMVVSLALTITFTGLLVLILPFYNGAGREFMITLFSKGVLIFSCFICLLTDSVEPAVDTVINSSAFLAANIIALVIAAILLSLEITRKN